MLYMLFILYLYFCQLILELNLWYSILSAEHKSKVVGW